MKQVTQSGSYIFLLISNCSQAQVLKVTYIFKIFRDHSCLVFVAYIFRTDSVIDSCSIKYPYSPATPNPLPLSNPFPGYSKKKLNFYKEKLNPRKNYNFFKIFSTFFNVFLTFSTNFNNKLGKITPDQGGKEVTEIKVVNHKIKNQFEIIVQSLKIKRPVRNNIDGDSVIHGTEIYAQHRRILRIDDSINSSDYFSY